MRARTFAALVVTAAIMIGCATIPPAQSERRVTELVEVLGTASAREFTSLAAVPFAYNGELAVRAADVELVWQTLLAGGFSLSGAELLTVEPIGRRAADEADTLDLEVFAQSLPEDATIARVLVDGVGEFELILGGERDRLPLIHGMRGPMR